MIDVAESESRVEYTDAYISYKKTKLSMVPEKPWHLTVTHLHAQKSSHTR